MKKLRVVIAEKVFEFEDDSAALDVFHEAVEKCYECPFLLQDSEGKTLQVGYKGRVEIVNVLVSSDVPKGAR